MRYELASSTWDEEEKQAIAEVVNSNMYTMGKNVREFEQKFANHFGTKYAVMTNSGSSANLIAVASFFYRQENPLKRFHSTKSTQEIPFKRFLSRNFIQGIPF